MRLLDKLVAPVREDCRDSVDRGLKLLAYSSDYFDTMDRVQNRRVHYRHNEIRHKEQ